MLNLSAIKPMHDVSVQSLEGISFVRETLLAKSQFFSFAMTRECYDPHCIIVMQNHAILNT